MGKFEPNEVGHLVEPGTYEDGDGLRLEIKARGSKSWTYRYQLNGRRREMGLGKFPTVSLKHARLLAADARKQLSMGIDPLAARDTQRAAQREAERQAAARRISFQQIALDYHAAHGASWSDKWRKGWLRKLELHAFPLIGHLSADAIQTEHILNVLRPIWAIKNRTADEVRGQIEQILDAAKTRGLREGDNPARWRGHLSNLLSRTEKKKARKRQHFPAMHWCDIPKLMAELSLLTSRDAVAARLLILTGARSKMIRFAQWSEFNWETKVWSLSSSRMKMREAFVIPLAREVITLLQGMERMEGSPYLFPGQGKSGVMHANAIRTLLHRMGYSNITRHGFRSSFRDWASDLTDYPREICELALDHDERDETESAYSRSVLLEKRRPLMADWARYATTAPTDNILQGVFKRE
ncbi:integrase arm-type DNA-binding domain-containing protein [Aeromonas sp. FDAARGOS 1409]|uniref:tyrosine-type recombinase/integrase n=1 Tax=Aeromonas TaxID=642 RepID=UPI001C21D9B4|nr:integrase arm-type DNA-binding domain-containing protein [Aeromonas sp. FDAARGOS 1409]QXC29906.1 integrase arm-type DNA-binding domain-containing protein [Aeromonas sp. FDAARGOS 1409]